MRRNSSLYEYAVRRRFLNRWKFGFELTEEEQAYLLEANQKHGTQIDLENDRFFCRFNGSLDRRYWRPISKTVV